MKWWQPLYTIWFCLSFIILFFIVVPFVLLFAAFQKPWASKCVYHILKVGAYAWFTLTGIWHIKLNKPAIRTPSVVILNHISYLDAVSIFIAIPSYFKILGKIEMARIPIFGLVYKTMVILVDRSSPKSRSRSMRLMYRVLRKEASIALFPEGTFNETSEPLLPFYDGAFRLAIQTQQPLLPILLLDSPKRWHYRHWWAMSPGKNRIYYMNPIPTKGLTESDIPSLKAQVHAQMSTLLKEFGYPYFKVHS